MMGKRRSEHPARKPAEGKVAGGRRAFAVALGVVGLAVGVLAVRQGMSGKGGPDAGALKRVAERASGFRTGARGGEASFAVFFDPPCAHCQRLWEQCRELERAGLGEVVISWHPVALNAASMDLAMQLLDAVDPAAAMDLLVSSTRQGVPFLGMGGSPGRSGVGSTAAGATVVEQNRAERLKNSIRETTEAVLKAGVEAVPVLVRVRGVRPGVGPGVGLGVRAAGQASAPASGAATGMPAGLSDTLAGDIQVGTIPSDQLARFLGVR